MKAMVVSATPKQLDSVGAWQTMMPSSVAASVSTSSTPTVYLATMRSRCEACMIRRLIGVWRMDVPMSATASRAASTTASSWVELPLAVTEDELATQAFERVDGLRRLLARGKDQDFRLRHCGSVVGYPGNRVVRLAERKSWLRGWRDQLSFIPLSLNTRFQRSSSLRTKASNSSGVLLTALMPDFSSLSAMMGSAYMLTTSR